jgi:hypothetical protein
MRQQDLANDLVAGADAADGRDLVAAFVVLGDRLAFDTRPGIVIEWPDDQTSSARWFNTML